jgi:uncharacterized protein (DUF433 family)
MLDVEGTAMSYPGNRADAPPPSGPIAGPAVLGPSGVRPETAAPSLPEGIEATPGVCGGDARIAGTRIPVWSLALARRLGATDARLLDEYPSLTPRDLANAWSYAEAHPDEVDRLIHENEVA